MSSRSARVAVSGAIVGAVLAGAIHASMEGSTRAAAAPAASSAAATALSYKKDIQSIFKAHCAACHLNGAMLGGLNLGTYQGLLKGGAVLKGAVIVPKKHAKSYLWQITQPKAPWPGGARMPLGGPYLSTKDITTIATWIDQGAKNN